MSDQDEYEDEYDGFDDDFCDHDDRDVDILTGRATCYRCGESWWMTDEQLRQEIRLAAEIYECIEAEYE